MSEEQFDSTPNEKGEQVQMNIRNEPDLIEWTFNPPITKMKLKPHEARTIAIFLLQHAEMAMAPATPSRIQKPPGFGE